ncbi:SsrA-binding protein [Citreimonas salinaria]|uniref:SsrA-binding protein n=2 Tax=Citreimonas salinaria TaxID=321339 RepID=A0A1H3HTV2_9RHOB|nr:SsrA-binding protein [Citreimonas salinaria]
MRMGVHGGTTPAAPPVDTGARRAYLADMASKPDDKNYKVIAENRRARFDYAIEDDLEVGIVLMGSEVKSLRLNSANIAESYAAVEDGELWLVNSYIAPYEQAMFGHEDRRRRKLLANRRELARMWNETQRKGMTLVPLVLYFNHKGIAKMKIGIAKGKKTVDKRETEAKRDWNRQKQRLLKERG